MFRSEKKAWEEYTLSTRRKAVLYTSIEKSRWGWEDSNAISGVYRRWLVVDDGSGDGVQIHLLHCTQFVVGGKLFFRPSFRSPILVMSALSILATDSAISVTR